MRLKRPREVWAELRLGILVTFIVFVGAAVLLALGRTLDGLQILRWQDLLTAVLWICSTAALALAAYFACSARLFNITPQQERRVKEYELEETRATCLLRRLEDIAKHLRKK